MSKDVIEFLSNELNKERAALENHINNFNSDTRIADMIRNRIKEIERLIDHAYAL